MTFERLMSRSFGKESFRFWQWHAGPRGLRFDEVERYLHEGGDVNRRTDVGKTLLHIAADNSQSDIVHLLVAHGADLNAQDQFGQTPLHYVVSNETDSSERDGLRATELPLTKLLIDLGADESIRTNDGQSPRDFAADNEEAAIYDSVSRFRRQA